jgi:NAD/NADP transhydrogenase alpha subunit
MKSYDIIRCSTLIRGERAPALCELQTFQAVRPICTVVDARAES